MNDNNTNNKYTDDSDDITPEEHELTKDLETEQDWEQHYKKHYKRYGYNTYEEYIQKQVKNGFDFLSFDSLSKTRNYPYHEWIGEAGKYNVIIIYKLASPVTQEPRSELLVGIGQSEMSAKMDIKTVATAPSYDKNANIMKIIKGLELTWKLPEGYEEE